MRRWVSSWKHANSLGWEATEDMTKRDQGRERLPWPALTYTPSRRHPTHGFSKTDVGPYYLSPILQELRRNDEIRGTKTKHRLKNDLCDELDKLGLMARGKTLKEVQEMTASYNIPLTIVENDVVEGWVGKPKGVISRLNPHLELRSAVQT
jgi:hypothetical protein